MSPANGGSINQSFVEWFDGRDNRSSGARGGAGRWAAAGAAPVLAGAAAAAAAAVLNAGAGAAPQPERLRERGLVRRSVRRAAAWAA